MTKVSLCFALLAARLAGQTADTTLFRVLLLPGNEVPAVNSTARGVADIAANVMRDSSGQIVSGSLDILLRTTLPAAVTATGLNLHNAVSGQTATVAISGGLAASNTRPLQSGADTLRITAAIGPANTAGLSALRAFLQDSSRFYLNLTTSDQPNGLMRGQVLKAQVAVLLGVLTSGDVVPAPNDGGRGYAQVVAIGTRDTAGNWATGEVYLWASALTSDPSGYNGFHLHAGATGTIGAIAIPATLPAGAAPDPDGKSAIGPLQVEIAVTNAVQTAAFSALFANPATVYVDLHSALNPGGILRAQLRATEATTLPLLLDSANEVSATAVRLQVPVNLTLHIARNEDGSIAAGTLFTEIPLRFAQAEMVLGLFVHDGAARSDGPVAIKAAPDFYAETGFGAWYGWSSPVFDLDELTDIVANPERHYLNLHTVSHPGGAARAQIGGAYARAAVAAVIAGNLDKAATVVAPGGLISIFGTDLAKVSAGLGGWAGQQLPSRLNGTRITLSGKSLPLLYVSPNQVNAQVPLDVPAGVQTLVVDNGMGAGAPYALTVAAAAPAIFFSPLPAIVKNANFSLVTAANPARAGEALLVYATGLGQTSPAIRTGTLVSGSGLAQTTPVGITVGGKPAAILYSAASPGFVGLYQVAFTVPAGLTGSQLLQIAVGGVSSNVVSLAMQ